MAMGGPTQPKSLFRPYPMSRFELIPFKLRPDATKPENRKSPTKPGLMKNPTFNTCSRMLRRWNRIDARSRHRRRPRLSTKGNSKSNNVNPNPNPHSFNSQRFSLNLKSKAAIIGPNFLLSHKFCTFFIPRISFAFADD
ncbi:hypothetical protein ACE6H2_015017 [Prunus campanulata]